jgi:hypothetical protein
MFAGTGMLTGMMPLMPTMTLALKQFYDQNDAAGRADRLREFSHAAWRRALRGTLTLEEAPTESRRLQDEIFEHRSKSPLILDRVYGWLRKEHEDLMNKNAEALVREAQEIIGRSMQAGAQEDM